MRPWLLITALALSLLSPPLSLLARTDTPPAAPATDETPSPQPQAPALDQPPLAAETYVSGVVLSRHKLPIEALPPALRPFGSTNEMETLNIKITGGADAGKTVQVNNMLSGHPGYDIQVTPGEAVLLQYEPTQPVSGAYNLADHLRSPALGILMALYLAGLLLFCGNAGTLLMVLTLVSGSLLITIAMPQLLEGLSPIAAVFLPLVLLLVTFYRDPALSEALKKVWVLSTAASLAILALSFLALSHLTHCAGFLNESFAGLWQLNSRIDFAQLTLIIGLIGFCGAIGALVKATLLKQQTLEESLSTEGVPKSPAIRQWADTLAPYQTLWTQAQAILMAVFVGISVPWMLELPNTSFEKLINLESTVLSLGLLLCGGLGLLICGPLTVWLSLRLAGSQAAQKLV